MSSRQSSSLLLPWIRWEKDKDIRLAELLKRSEVILGVERKAKFDALIADSRSGTVINRMNNLQSLKQLNESIGALVSRFCTSSDKAP